MGVGEEDRPVERDGLGGEENLEIRGELFLFAPEKILLPDATGPGVVVVAGDGVNRDADFADRRAEGGDRRLVGGEGIEEVAANDDEIKAAFSHQGRKPANGLDPLSAENLPLGRIADGLKWLADLPVGGVEERGHRGRRKIIITQILVGRVGHWRGHVHVF